MMKKLPLKLLSLFLLFSYLCSGQTTDIPDPNFEQALIDLGIDDVIDGKVTNSNVKDLIILDVSNMNISDLTGIEAFVNLRQLYCNNNVLTSLDVSANIHMTLLYCHFNQLITLDVSNNTELTNLNCAHNMLNGLNVDSNPALDRLFCAANDISTLNLSNNALLSELYCDQNRLTSLDVGNNTSLEVLNCAANQIDVLNVTNNLALTKLYCFDNSLDILNVQFNTALTDLFCNGNNLTSLNLNNNTELRNLWCQSNSLNSLKVKNGTNTNINLFNATNNTNLTCIDVDDPPYSTANWTQIDSGTVFSEECNPDPIQVTLAPDGSLSITDNTTTPSNDNYEMSISDGNLILSNTTPIAFSGDGIVQIDPYTVQIPLSSITNGLTIDGQGGDNNLIIDAPLLLGENNNLTVNNIRSVVRGNGNLNLNALNVTNGDFNINELITIVATAANFYTNARLSGQGTLTGNVNMRKDSKIKPGNSPGILNSSNLLLEFDSTFDAEVNGSIPGTEHDQINVVGTVTINNAILNLTGGYENNHSDEIILINNDGEDAIVGQFNYSEGERITFGEFEGYITYRGGDGNDVSLKSNGTAPEIICPEDIALSNTLGSCSTLVNFNATEMVGIPASVITYSHEPGSSFALGKTVVTVTATNAFGSSSCSFDVIVTNTIPSNTDGILGGIDPINAGTDFTLFADFNDNNLSSVTWYFSSDGDFTNGDIAEYVFTGSYLDGVALGSFNFDVSQTGVYTVKVEVEDLCGEKAESKYNYLVIYDPGGGFVTGGGWIQSPYGALVGYNVTGKANFGLVAKYKSGKNNVLELDGITNFQFNEGNFHFKSNAYDEMSLVVSGKKKATYRGSGMVNGFGSHKFLVTVIDGDAIGGDGYDKFRIKIWADGSSSEVIYDNEFNTPENADSITVLGGGSIVIHQPKSKNGEASKNISSITAEEVIDGLEVMSWPNPSTSFFNLEVKSNNLKDDVEVMVFDMTNKLVHQGYLKPNADYSLGLTLPGGVYILRVTQSGKSKTIKVIRH